MRMRVGGDGSVHSGKWLQTWVRNKLLLFFFSFCTRLLSFTALPGGHNENDLLPGVWNRCKSEWNRQREASCASCTSFKYESWRKIHGLQTDSVMIAPPGTGCFPISRHQAFPSNRTHKVFTWKSKLRVPGAEMPKKKKNLRKINKKILFCSKKQPWTQALYWNIYGINLEWPVYVYFNKLTCM